MPEFIRDDVRFFCRDGVELAGTLYVPQQSLKAAIIIAPATGIKRQFYAAFASFLAENGYAVLAYDNRGIGDSKQGRIQRSDISLQCWGEQDLAAAIQALKDHFPGVDYHLAGHSAGGQLIGLTPQAKDLTSVFNVACSSGRLLNMKLSYQFKAHFFMNVFIPVSNALFGVTQSQWVGMGEPLPPKVAGQWRTWCNGQGYVKTAFGKTVHQHVYDELDMPMLWVHASDDDIANSKNVADMISVFTAASTNTLTLEPKEQGVKEIGHMKFFSRKNQKLWQYALDWFARA